MFCFPLCIWGILDIHGFQGLWELGAWLRFSTPELTQGMFQTALHLTDGYLWELSTYQVWKVWAGHYGSGEEEWMDKRLSVQEPSLEEPSV